VVYANYFFPSPFFTLSLMKRLVYGKQLKWLLYALAGLSLAIFLKHQLVGFQWFELLSGYGK